MTIDTNIEAKIEIEGERPSDPATTVRDALITVANTYAKAWNELPSEAMADLLFSIGDCPSLLEGMADEVMGILQMEEAEELRRLIKERPVK